MDRTGAPDSAQHLVLLVTGPEEEIGACTMGTIGMVVKTVLAMAKKRVTTPLLHSTEEKRGSAQLRALEISCTAASEEGTLEICARPSALKSPGAQGIVQQRGGNKEHDTDQGWRKPDFCRHTQGTERTNENGGYGSHSNGVNTVKGTAHYPPGREKDEADWRDTEGTMTIALWDIDPLLDQRGIAAALRRALSLLEEVRVEVSEPRLARAQV